MLSYQALITVKKIGSHREQFSEDEKNSLSEIILTMFLRGRQQILGLVDIPSY